nr:3-ketoacyl-CoA synthase 12-like [Ipomoea batatas]
MASAKPTSIKCGTSHNTDILIMPSGSSEYPSLFARLRLTVSTTAATTTDRKDTKIPHPILVFVLNRMGFPMILEEMAPLLDLLYKDSMDLLLFHLSSSLDGDLVLLHAVVNSSIREETYVPWNILEGREDCGTLADGIEEMEECFFDTLEKLFVKSEELPAEVGVLVVNVSMLSPASSLCSRNVRHFALREDGGGRASGRDTIGRVAAGAVAKKILKQIATTEILAYTSQVHTVVLPDSLVDFEALTVPQHCDLGALAELTIQALLAFILLFRNLRDGWLNKLDLPPPSFECFEETGELELLFGSATDSCSRLSPPSVMSLDSTSIQRSLARHAPCAEPSPKKIRRYVAMLLEGTGYMKLVFEQLHSMASASATSIQDSSTLIYCTKTSMNLLAVPSEFNLDGILYNGKLY